MSVTLIKPEQFTIGLPRERGMQLRAIAAARGTTVVSIIEDMIARSVEAGEIEDDLKGFGEIIPDDDVLFVSIRGAPLPGLDSQQATTLSLMLDLAAGRPIPGFDITLAPGKGNLFDFGHGVKVGIGRHSSAVLISIIDASTGEPTMKTATTPSIAADFARLLRKHLNTLAPSPNGIELSMLKAA